MAKTITLVFKGYRWDVDKDGLDEYSGVYLVYRCKQDPQDNTISIKELLYIGEAENIRDRICNDQEKRECWEGELKTDEVLCYSRAPAVESDQKRAEAALIFKLKPICNDQG